MLIPCVIQCSRHFKISLQNYYNFKVADAKLALDYFSKDIQNCSYQTKYQTNVLYLSYDKSVNTFQYNTALSYSICTTISLLEYKFSYY